MRAIMNLNELNANLDKLDEYLTLRIDPEYSFAVGLVKKGICFVVTKSNDSYRFYLSRFIGYECNSMVAHLNNKNRDGRKTNSTLSKILGKNPSTNSELDKLYKEYCKTLGFATNEKGSFGVERKYWAL